MIKIITSEDGKIEQFDFRGDVEEVAKELISSIITVRDIIQEQNKDLARIFEISAEEYLEIGIYKNREDGYYKVVDPKEINEMGIEAERLKQLIKLKMHLDKVKKNAESGGDNAKDIRAADFDSDEQFKEWFRGADE